MLKTEFGVAVMESRRMAPKRGRIGCRKEPTKGSPVAMSPSG